MCHGAVFRHFAHAKVFTKHPILLMRAVHGARASTASPKFGYCGNCGIVHFGSHSLHALCAGMSKEDAMKEYVSTVESQQAAHK